ncbi:CRISPR-associated protein, TM1812 family [Saprospira grandis DSM 2844]|uniref:CRISPR-associated protein, TM1812 family n=1 Tax=Saprospira grandis DSM 2844 TaxID=694433 RepID=J0P3Q9_9BACT|nr:TIGR02221 family CRISPR-associated protein [Saprospira grandis]EJF54479.1 CRISPR-associated protein, TM1812 family [Saprospira grandis DSM 2844]
MGRKVFLSFLGTNNYLACNYENSKGKIENVRFVQEAILQLECSQFTEEDRVFVFCTAEARKKNWVDLDEEKGLGQDPARLADPVLDRIGLYSRLVELKNSGKLQATFDQEPIFIEDGFSEQEVWKIFEAVYKVLEEGDEVYLDITHSFRFMPMLSIVLMNYAKLLKGVTIKSISYGAFEKLGPAYKLKSVPVEDRNAPIVDISSFAELQDWTNAVREFKKYGKTESFVSLAAGAYSELAEKIKAVEQSINTNRGRRIYQGDIFKELNQVLDRLKEIDPKPLQDLVRIIQNKVSEFDGHKTLDNGKVAVEWCIDHQMTQQGITILDELVTSVLCEKIYGSKSIKNAYKRNLVNAMFYVVKDNLPVSKWSDVLKGRDAEVNQFRDIVDLELVELKRDLSLLRNDINHSGYTKNNNPDNFDTELVSIYNKIKRFL